MAMRGLAHWRGSMRKLGGHWESLDEHGEVRARSGSLSGAKINMGQVGRAWKGGMAVRKLGRTSGGLRGPPVPVRPNLLGLGTPPAKAGGLMARPAKTMGLQGPSGQGWRLWGSSG